MAGRAQKYAAATVAACGLAGSVCAQEPAGAALIPAQSITAGELRWTGADALGRWSLVAGAERARWDAAADSTFLPLPFVPAAELRHALEGDRASGRLAFQWHRDAAARRFEASFIATRAALVLRDDPSPAGVASVDDRIQDRAQRTRMGLSVSMTEAGSWLGLPGERSMALRAADDRFDQRTWLAGGGSGAQSLLRRDGSSESRVAMEMRQSFRLGPVDVQSALRTERLQYETERFDTVVAPSMAIAWHAFAGSEFFARASRGRDDFSRPLAVRDPWTGRSTGLLDPDVRRDFAETGARWRIGALEWRASAWQAHAASRLAYTEAGPIPSARSDDRRGYGLGLRYQPVPWLDASAEVLLDAAGSSAVDRRPGAPQAFGSAGATVRMSRDWDARLAVNYLGPRDGAEEEATLRSATLVNAQLVRWLGNTTRISLDVFNLFNERVRTVDSFAAARTGMLEGTGDNFLSSPAEPRGFLLKLRTRF